MADDFSNDADDELEIDVGDDVSHDDVVDVGHDVGDLADEIHGEFEEDLGEFGHEAEEFEGVEVDDQGTYVSSAPARNMLVMGVLIVASIVFLYNMVFKEEESVKKEKKIAEIIESQPVEEAKEATQQEEQIEADIGVVETPDFPGDLGLEVLPPPVPMPFENPEITFPDEPYRKFVPAPLPSVQEPVEVVKPKVEKKPNLYSAVQPPVEEKEEEVEETLPVVEQPLPVVGAEAVVGPSLAEIAARKARRRKADMIVVNGGGVPADLEDESGGTDSLGSPAKLSKTSATQVTATRVGNLGLMIAQGKMIDAVLETAINTDLPGSLRAVISRDVYAESGKNILIPRGSRLIGDYNSNITQGQKRVIVNWNRVIRPDGVDINIGSPGTDQLGHAGMTGIVDNKYLEILSNSVLLSAITIGGTIVVDSIRGSDNTSSSSTVGVDGSQTSSQSGTPVDFAVMDSVESFGEVTKSIADGLLDQQPTITVSQGSRIKVFVNKDLIFPESTVGKITFVE